MNKTRVINYIVKVNGEVAEGFSSLKEARNYVKNRATLDVPTIVEIVKSVTVESVLSTYVPQSVTTLVETNLSDDSLDTGIQEA